MKLHQLNRGDRFTLDGHEAEGVMVYEKTDGMYANVRIGSPTGELALIAAWAPVTRLTQRSCADQAQKTEG